MDPLSLTASIITVIGVGGQAVGAMRKLARLRGAPDLALALNNELNDLRLVVSAIQDIYQRQRGNEAFSFTSATKDVSFSVTHTLRLAKEKTDELEALCDRLQISSSGSFSSNRIRRMSWLKSQTHIRRIQQDLRDVRIKLTGALGMLSSDYFPYLKEGVDGLHSSLKDFHTAQQRSDSVASQRLIDQERSIQALNGRINSMQRVQERDQIRDASIPVSMLGVRSAGRDVCSQRVELKLTASEATRIAQTAEAMALRSSVLSKESVMLPLGLAAATAIAVAVPYAAAQCFTGCGCICHLRHTKRSPMFLDKLLGALFFGYYGLPYLVPECDKVQCVQRSCVTARITYRFPAWLLARSFALSTGWSSTSGLGINIQFPRAINSCSKVLSLAEQGDTEGIKILFQQGLGSPLDASASDGETALKIAVSRSHLDLCRFLLHAGADPHQENHRRLTAFRTAWDHILGSSVDADTREQLRILFPAHDYIDDQEFSLLHKTVLGLSRLDLDDLLASVPESMINSCDINGRTSLFWAAGNGDAKAVLSLLESKAEVGKASHAGFFPLDMSMFYRHQECSRLLLQHMHSTRCADRPEHSPLHYGAHFGAEPDVLDRIIDLGTDIDLVILNGSCSALMSAVQANQYRVCQHLLSRHADPNITNDTGETALHIGIDFNSHESLQLLLPHANYRLKTHAGETLFHYAAQHADAKTLEILYANDLHEIDTSDVVTGISSTQQSTKVRGLDGLQIAELRTDVAPEWLATFRKLKEKIDRSMPVNQTIPAPEDLDEF